MADVDIVINDRTYRISCKDGEEERIKLLSSKIDNEVKLLAGKIGQLGEARMILLATLVLLDKFDDNQFFSMKFVNLTINISYGRMYC